MTEEEYINKKMEIYSNLEQKIKLLRNEAYVEISKLELEYKKKQKKNSK